MLAPEDLNLNNLEKSLMSTVAIYYYFFVGYNHQFPGFGFHVGTAIKR